MKAQFAAIMVLVGALVSGTAAGPVQAQSGMSVDVTTTDGLDLTISGMSAKSDPISVKVEHPQSGNIIYVGQAKPEADGSFSFHSSAGILGWPEDGIYRVTVKQKDASAYNLNLNIKVEEGRIVTESVSKSSLTGIITERMLGEVEPELVGLMMDVTADEGADFIRINGQTTSGANAITVLVTSPTGNHVHTDQLTPSSSGYFEADINLGCQQWSEDGVYTITVQQGTNTLFKESADVEIAQCVVVPEFGAVAMAVLLASIVAIVVLGARSRLSVLPRY